MHNNYGKDIKSSLMRKERRFYACNLSKQQSFLTVETSKYLELFRYLRDRVSNNGQVIMKPTALAFHIDKALPNIFVPSILQFL